MKDSANYYQQRNIKNLDRIDELLQDLPYFCEDYLRGVETRTSTLTRLNYVYDLRIFFDFLSKKNIAEKRYSISRWKIWKRLPIPTLKSF